MHGEAVDVGEHQRPQEHGDEHQEHRSLGSRPHVDGGERGALGRGEGARRAVRCERHCGRHRLGVQRGDCCAALRDEGVAGADGPAAADDARSKGGLGKALVAHVGLGAVGHNVAAARKQLPLAQRHQSLVCPFAPAGHEIDATAGAVGQDVGNDVGVPLHRVDVRDVVEANARATHAPHAAADQEQVLVAIAAGASEQTRAARPNVSRRTASCEGRGEQGHHRGRYAPVARASEALVAARARRRHRARVVVARGDRVACGVPGRGEALHQLRVVRRRRGRLLVGDHAREGAAHVRKGEPRALVAVTRVGGGVLQVRPHGLPGRRIGGEGQREHRVAQEEAHVLVGLIAKARGAELHEGEQHEVGHDGIGLFHD